MASYKAGCPPGPPSSLFPSGVTTAKLLNLSGKRDPNLRPVVLRAEPPSRQRTGTAARRVKILQFFSALVNSQCPGPSSVPCGPRLPIPRVPATKTQRGLRIPGSALFQAAVYSVREGALLVAKCFEYHPWLWELNMNEVIHMGEITDCKDLELFSRSICLL